MYFGQYVSTNQSQLRIPMERSLSLKWRGALGVGPGALGAGVQEEARGAVAFARSLHQRRLAVRALPDKFHFLVDGGACLTLKK